MEANRIHGGPRTHELEALGIDRDDLVDFSVNLNPYGPDPSVVAAIAAAKVDLYPDPTALDARIKVAAAIGSAAGADSPDSIALGNGAADLLWVIARACLGPGRSCLMVEPTFSELRAAAVATGAQVIEWRARPGDGFAIDLAAVGDLVAERWPDAIYLCLPNNPTGATVPAQSVAEFAQKFPATKVVLDQSFSSLGDLAAEMDHPMPPNVIRVRSLTKDHTLAGVRVGYLLADAAIVKALQAQRPEWSTSALAEAAAVAALGAADFVEASRKKLLADRTQMELALTQLGYFVFPSWAPYLLVEVGDAARLRTYLLAEHEVLVRDCSSFGLPTCVRLAARPFGQVERLLAGLRQWRALHA